MKKFTLFMAFAALAFGLVSRLYHNHQESLKPKASEHSLRFPKREMLPGSSSLSRVMQILYGESLAPKKFTEQLKESQAFLYDAAMFLEENEMAYRFDRVQKASDYRAFLKEGPILLVVGERSSEGRRFMPRILFEYSAEKKGLYYLDPIAQKKFFVSAEDLFVEQLTSSSHYSAQVLRFDLKTLDEEKNASFLSFHHAFKLVRKGQRRKATELFIETLGEDELRVPTYFYLALLVMEKKRWQRAVDYLAECLKSEKDFYGGLAHYKMALCYGELKRKTLKAESLEKFLDEANEYYTEKEMIEARLWLGQYYESQ